MAATIQNNSVYLADDFIQALGNAQPAQLTKFQLVKLPDWSETLQAGYMNVTAERLGLAGAIVNPNELLPAVFEQYWQNLSAHVRKHHATVDSGKVIENFTEQSFWKCIATLLNVMPLDLPATMVTAELSNIITNINTTDGNASMETLLAIPANTSARSFIWKPVKPTFLSTIKLPEQSTDMTLVGNKTAMYDNDLTYYNLANSQCIHAVAGDQLTTTCQYNAVLLYYSDGDVEQLAGIYFPSKFVKSVGDTWTLPTISIATDTTVGYTINIMFCGGGSVNYIASNANANLAMQAYSNMYTKLSNANLAISELSNKVASMQLNIDNLMRILNNGVLASMQNAIDDCKAQLATHFDGSISTDKLLQLFLQAKRSTGNLQLNLSMSDLSKAVLGSEIVVHGNSVGQYKAGDVLEVGTSITDILRKMLDSRNGVPYVQPFASMLKNNANFMLVTPGSLNAITDIMAHVEPGDAGPLVNRFIYAFDDKTVVQTTTIASTNDFAATLPVRMARTAGMRLHTLQQVYSYSNGDEHTYSDGSVIEGAVLAGSMTASFYAIPFEHVAIIYSNANVTIDNVIDRINGGDLHLDFVDSTELSMYNQVTNDVAFIIEMPAITMDETVSTEFADLGIYSSINTVDTRLDILQNGAELPARITRIHNWDGILNTEHVRPSAIFD